MQTKTAPIAKTGMLIRRPAGAKAWLEHGFRLNLVRDKFPDRGPG